jgi:Amt family ammonium transporter
MGNLVFMQARTPHAFAHHSGIWYDFAMTETLSLPIWPLLAAAFSFLLIWAMGALITTEQRHLPALSLLLAVVGYAATGFALHFGGIGILIDHPDVAALVWEWTPLRHGNLAHWGVAGWMGFGLNQAQTPVAALLFITALPLVSVTALLSLRSLEPHLSLRARLIFALLMTAILAPLAGNWTQAGGWLMHLGQSLGAGDGYLDFGGASFFLLAGGVALAALLTGRKNLSPTPEPDTIAGIGALMAGGIGWILASPLHLWAGSSPSVGAMNSLLALAAGGLIGLVYGLVGPLPLRWFSRSAAAGWIAALAPLPWMNPWQAMLTGAIAAWIYILAAWGLRARGRHDAGDSFAAFGLPALWGLLAVGFFAPMPGQFKAQLFGIATLFLLSFLFASLFLLLGQIRSTATSGN